MINQSLFFIAFFAITFSTSTITPLSLVHGSWSAQGERTSQQDRYVSNTFGIEDKQVYCFGIFDGHGQVRMGHLVAQYAQNHLHNELAPKVVSLFQSNNLHRVPDLIQESFQEFDKDLKNKNPNFTFNSGTTATTIMIIEDHCIVANVGDSQAYLQVSNLMAPQVLTENHVLNENFCKQFEKSDTTYLEKRVTTEIFYQDFPFNQENCIRRIHHNTYIVAQYDNERGAYESLLNLSRTLGDSLFFPHVTALPFVQNFSLTPEHQFIIIASDGLWDNMTGKAATNFVLAYLQENDMNIQTITPDQAQTIAQALVDASLTISKHDNTTATIIFFQHTP
ncbi:protein serine/threonine phosphatase 2C family protein [Candidatus Dependentiae bacterium]|jgi:serine/threonine protein phosphatase PrpC|nr:protein serine/threonine phosphatase 2C family protein [Candidatus Dependentiae bacterium]